MTPPQVALAKAAPIVDVAPNCGEHEKRLDRNQRFRWLLAVAADPFRQLSPAALALAVLIRERYSEKAGHARFSLDHAEAVLGYKRAALSKAIAQLEEAGFLRRSRSDRRKSNEYELLLAAVLQAEEHIAGRLLILKSRQLSRAAGFNIDDDEASS